MTSTYIAGENQHTCEHFQHEVHNKINLLHVLPKKVKTYIHIVKTMVFLYLQFVTGMYKFVLGQISCFLVIEELLY